MQMLLHKLGLEITSGRLRPKEHVAMRIQMDLGVQSA